MIVLAWCKQSQTYIIVGTLVILEDLFKEGNCSDITGTKASLVATSWVEASVIGGRTTSMVVVDTLYAKIEVSSLGAK